ncbi:MAG: CtsR family transcriptional regulator [Ruminococcaceae bacterium]|nr:CtsR family transcriptional regulator [Oscillospiraceae bacterium]
MLTDYIAQIIDEMLNESGGDLEIKRNEMAMKIGCVPSQISYVITSRFTPERGYIIESRKGGGGCIRIVRKQMHKNEYLMHFFYAIGDRITENEAVAYINNLLGQDIVSPREAVMMNGALSNSALSALPRPVRDEARAGIFKHMVLSIMQ